MSIHGFCLCGECSFVVPATSVRFGFASCHCSTCRLSHASPFVLWSGLNADRSDDFKLSMDETLLTGFRSSISCTRYFCKKCGTHLYIKYDDANVDEVDSIRWAGEIHFPTSIITPSSLKHLEEVMEATGKPRQLHVFTSEKQPYLGDLAEWAAAPKFGGETGLEPILPPIQETPKSGVTEQDEA